MAVTLLMMGAVVNLFANVSASVNNNTAKMEQSARLRTARQVLEVDLAGATCPPYPWREPGEDVGYFEIVEGERNESTPTLWVRDLDGDGQLLQADDVDLANGTTLDPASSLLPRNNFVLDYNTDGVVDDNDRQAHFQQPNSLVPGGIGDFDDILAMTVRSDDKPFVGRAIVLRANGDPNNADDYNTVTLESNLAEVIWYAVENPPDGSLGEPGMRTIYRRVLLIAPWLPEVNLTGFGYGALDPDDAALPISFFGRFDISARYNQVSGTWVPNTLGDLTKRENRFAHFGSWPVTGRAAATLGYPHRMDDDAIRYVINEGEVTLINPASVSPLRPFGLTASDPATGLPDRTGQDVMLSDVLTWDLRVYDPGAPLITNAAGTAVLEPSDPGWRQVLNTANPTVPPLTPLGYGAFVDLGWGFLPPGLTLRTLNSTGAEPTILFNAARRTGWHPARPNQTGTVGFPAVFDAWSLHYERDNLDQDNDSGTTAPSGLPQIDEGINGFDDDNQNGVDDILERETAPPYDTPLRGVQARIRIYERNARSIRSATVTKNFVPE